MIVEMRRRERRRRVGLRGRERCLRVETHEVIANLQTRGERFS